MKKGEIYEAIVEKVEFPNKGIVHVGEEKVIVKNAIPGQKIQFVINKKRNGKCEGRLLEVLEASELNERKAHVLILAYAAAVCTRAFHTKNS